MPRGRLSEGAKQDILEQLRTREGQPGLARELAKKHHVSESAVYLVRKNARKKAGTPKPVAKPEPGLHTRLSNAETEIEHLKEVVEELRRQVLS